MVADSFQESMGGKIVRAILVVIGATLMITPAYLNYELGPVKLGFEAATSMGLSLTLFAIGIILFIVAVGPEKFNPRASAQ